MQFPSVEILVPVASNPVPPAVGAHEKVPPTPQLNTRVVDPPIVTNGAVIVLVLRSSVPEVSVAPTVETDMLS